MFDQDLTVLIQQLQYNNTNIAEIGLQPNILIRQIFRGISILHVRYLVNKFNYSPPQPMGKKEENFVFLLKQQKSVFRVENFVSKPLWGE